MERRKFLKMATGTAALGVIGQAPAYAQAWPRRPVRFVVSFAAGGATDLVARPWAEVLGKAFKQQFIVENRGGASGAIGNELAFRSEPDGYTFLFSSSTATVTLPLVRKLSFDARKFMPVARMGNTVTGFTIHPGVGPRTLQETLEYARKNPGKLNFGSSGVGTQPHLRYEMLRLRTGVDIAHIPYRGGADSLIDLLAGNIQMMNEASTLPHVKNGRLILLNINGEERFSEFPDVPTLTEAGVKDADISSWFALYAPPGTPAEIISQINTKVNEISATQQMKDMLRAVWALPVIQTVEEIQKFWDNDMTRTAELIKAIGLKLE